MVIPPNETSVSAEDSVTVTVNWNHNALLSCSAYGLSEQSIQALTLVLAENPTCGLRRPEVPYFRSLPWTTSQPTQAAELPLTIWYIYTKEAGIVDVIAISEPKDDLASDKQNNEAARRLVGRIRDGYLGYRVGKLVVDHWDDIKEFFFHS
jgi:hypothetical protein